MEKVAPGDHVAVSFLPCGRCRLCFDGSPASCANFNAVNFAGRRLDGSHAQRPADGDSGGIRHDRFFGQSSFATHAVTNERNTVKLRPDPAGTPGPARLRHPDRRRDGSACAERRGGLHLRGDGSRRGRPQRGDGRTGRGDRHDHRRRRPARPARPRRRAGCHPHRRRPRAGRRGGDPPHHR
ncbi:alcohol dehydrogenase catalytic domain-containing protein [Streptomyces sp. S12]|nr:alcohol dehydrogenase catalytic domain-containing protein [Streptomyces sp. S12]